MDRAQMHMPTCCCEGDSRTMSVSLWSRTFQHSFEGHKVPAINLCVAALVVMSCKQGRECSAGQQHALQLPPVPRHMGGTRSTCAGGKVVMPTCRQLLRFILAQLPCHLSASPGPTWWCAATSTRSPAASAAASSDLSHLQVTSSSLMGYSLQRRSWSTLQDLLLGMQHCTRTASALLHTLHSSCTCAAVLC